MGGFVGAKSEANARGDCWGLGEKGRAETEEGTPIFYKFNINIMFLWILHLVTALPSPLGEGKGSPGRRRDFGQNHQNIHYESRRCL